MKQLFLVSLLFMTAYGQPGSIPFGNTGKELPVLGTANPDGTIQRVSDFLFIDQYGDTVTDKSLKGKIYLAGAFNTTCTSEVQKIMLHGLAMVQRAFKDTTNFYILSFSMDPEKDSVAKLKAFSKANNITGPRRFLLTGNMTDSAMVNFIRNNFLLSVMIAKENPNCGFIHTDTVVLIDRQGQRRGYYDLGKNKAIEQLIEDVQTLFRE